jgi:E3 ubiquitin-protein ligase SIAH1
MEYMRPPIILCVNGHNICDICRAKLANCPTCRKRFLSTRSVGLEKLAREIQYPCTYRQFGCMEVFAHDKLDKHQAKCLYRQLTCPAARCSPDIQCDWNGNYSEVRNHLMENHLEMCSDYGEIESRSFLALCFHGWYNKFVFVYDEVFFRGIFF